MTNQQPNNFNSINGIQTLQMFSNNSINARNGNNRNVINLNNLEEDEVGNNPKMSDQAGDSIIVYNAVEEHNLDRINSPSKDTFGTL